MTTFSEVKCVGMHWREAEGVPARALVSNMITPCSVELEREPENQYDSFAVKVIYDGQHIGYIEAKVACWLAPRIDNGETFSAEVTDFTVHRNNTYPLMHIVFSE